MTDFLEQRSREGSQTARLGFLVNAYCAWYVFVEEGDLEGVAHFAQHTSQWLLNTADVYTRLPEGNEEFGVGRTPAKAFEDYRENHGVFPAVMGTWVWDDLGWTYTGTAHESQV